MARRNDEGLIDEMLDELVVRFKAEPAAGVIGASLFAGVAAYLQWGIPNAMYGLASLFAIVAWMMAGLAALAAGVGFLSHRRRQQRLEFQHTIADLRAMDWRQFEQLVADVFRRQGYRVEEIGGPSDGGVDLVLRGKNGIEHLVQCKHYRDWKVGVPKLREFYGAMAAWQTRCEGLYVTCGQFTEDARSFAVDKPLRLIDGEQLLEIIVATNPVKPPVARPVELLSQPSAGSDSEAVPRCPDCGVPMVKRTARRGAHAGQPFWGCRNYPKCHRVIDLVSREM